MRRERGEEGRRSRENRRKGISAERERVCEGQNTGKECKTKEEHSKDVRERERKVQNNKVEG